MLRRAGQLLSRFRRAAPSQAVVIDPPRCWTEELAEAGLSATDWVRRRLATDGLYVHVREARLASLREEHSVLVQATIDRAEQVLRHEFNLLGSGPYTPEDPDRGPDPRGYRPIDWYLDPVSGLRFPRAVPLATWDFERMRPGRADIKLPWELARCQHWPMLGQAYRLTGDDRFALEIARELDDFLAANPIGTAVNWACTMDVALRAANWAIALQLVRTCSELTTAFWLKAYEALFDHGSFIESHLENTYEVTSNHFLSDVTGLFFVAAVLEDLPRGQVWNRQCRRWLTEEMSVQVLPDGADYESSIPYHRLVTELFLGAARLADYKRAPFPEGYQDRLRRMVDFLAAVQRPDGLLPQVGDADDGRLHILSGYGGWQPQDARHLFGPAGCLFRNADWVSMSGEWGDWESAWWGFDRLEAGTRQPLARDGGHVVRHFPHAGLTVMRRQRQYLLVTNGVVGTGGFGNHKHNDQLGFEFHVEGVPLVVDPGSYVYTSDPDARNLFRSTRSHNTVIIDDAEQNELRPHWLFRMFEKASPEHLAVDESDEQARYRGRHYGYSRLSEPVVHERTFTLSMRDGALTIVDLLNGQGAHRVRWHFHFAPGVEVSALGPERFRVVSGATAVELTAPAALRFNIASAWYSPSYGVRTACVALDFETEQRFDGPREFRFRIAR